MTERRRVVLRYIGGEGQFMFVAVIVTAERMRLVAYHPRDLYIQLLLEIYIFVAIPLSNTCSEEIPVVRRENTIRGYGGAIAQEIRGLRDDLNMSETVPVRVRLVGVYPLDRHIEGTLSGIHFGIRASQSKRRHKPRLGRRRDGIACHSLQSRTSAKGETTDFLYRTGHLHRCQKAAIGKRIHAYFGNGIRNLAGAGLAARANNEFGDVFVI